MPLRDQVAMEASLDNDYGPTRGPQSPAAFEVALFAADPDLGGVELAGNGYARGALSNDDWDPATGGIKTSAAVTLGTPTGVWATATHVGLYDPAAAAWWDVVPLAEPLDVTGAGDAPTVTVSIFYDNNLD